MSILKHDNKYVNYLDLFNIRIRNILLYKIVLSSMTYPVQKIPCNFKFKSITSNINILAIINILYNYII